MKKNIKQLSNKELYNNLIPIITDIILKYDWITITNELIINVINIVKEEYQENMGNFENYFKKRLESAIHFEIKKTIK